jgi:hypothetical protein
MALIVDEGIDFGIVELRVVELVSLPEQSVITIILDAT